MSYDNSFDFGKSWKISSASNLDQWDWDNSNFNVDDQMDDRYNDNYFVYDEMYHTSFIRPRLLEHKISREISSDACERIGLTGESLTTCRLDVLATGDESFANSESNKMTLCPNGCGGHGVCVSKDTCSCSKGWSGSDCSKGECVNDCSPNGKCDKGFCICNDGWEGVDCKTKADCSQLNGCTNPNNGLCARSKKCSCYPGFGGNDCSQVSLCVSLNKCNKQKQMILI